MKASIILVGYNSRLDLEGCLDSLRRAGSPDVEILLVDNASQDGTAAWVRDMYPEVRVIRSETNLGFGGANNLAAAQAQGEFLAFLNPDTRVEPGWLEALVAALESNPEAGLATSKILLMHHGDTINTCGNDVHITGLTLCRGAGEPCSEFNQVGQVNAVSGAAFAIRRDLFDSLGGFDAGYFLYMEDTDLSLVARINGSRCFFVPGSVVYHDYRLNFGPRKTYYQERNRYRLLIKIFQVNTLLRLFPALLLAEAVTWGFVLLRDRRRLGNKIKAYAWLIAHLGEVRAARRQVQHLRRISDAELIRELNTSLAFEQTGGGMVAWAAHKFFDPLFSLTCRQAGVARSS